MVDVMEKSAIRRYMDMNVRKTRFVKTALVRINCEQRMNHSIRTEQVGCRYK